jgi:hypothetical protein
MFAALVVLPTHTSTSGGVERQQCEGADGHRAQIAITFERDDGDSGRELADGPSKRLRIDRIAT